MLGRRLGGQGLALIRGVGGREGIGFFVPVILLLPTTCDE